MRRPVHRFATWLVLAAYTLSGFSPAQQLVLCFEPDGSVVLEAAELSGCAPCGPEQGPSWENERLATDCCPCIDIPLPTQDEAPQAEPKASEGHGVAAALHPPICIPPITRAEPARPVLSTRAEPRPAPGLALLRTVVLRV